MHFKQGIKSAMYFLPLLQNTEAIFFIQIFSVTAVAAFLFVKG